MGRLSSRFTRFRVQGTWLQWVFRGLWGFSGQVEACCRGLNNFLYYFFLFFFGGVIIIIKV